MDSNNILYYSPFLGFYLIVASLFIYSLLKSKYEKELCKTFHFITNGWILVGLSSFLTIPLIESTVLIQACGNNFHYDCFSVTHIIIVIAGFILLLFLLIYLAFSTFLFQLPDLKSKIPWSLISPMSNLLLLVIKVALVFIHILDPNMIFGIIYSIIFILLESLRLWLTFTNPISSSALFYYSDLGLNIWGLTQLLFNIYSFIVGCFSFNPYAYIFIQFISIFGLILIRRKLQINSFLKFWLNKSGIEMKSLYDSENFLLEIGNNKSSQKEKIYFWGNIYSHKGDCNDQNCECNKIRTDLSVILN